MLRRHSTKSRADISRRKSTSSARSVYLEHIDATVAQRDATIAAAYAFVRNQDRPDAEISLFPSPSTSSPQHAESKTPRSKSLSIRRVDTGREIRPRQSVRFVGPGRVKSTSKSALTAARTSQGRNKGDDISLATPNRSRGHISPGTTVLRSTQNVQARKVSQSGESPYSADSLVGGFINSLSAGDEYYTPEDDIASAPSSYRRLRRSQSSFRPRSSADGTVDSEPSLRYFNSSTPDRRRQPLPLSSTTSRLQESHSNKENYQPLSRSPNSQLRAPKSMSFLKRGHSRMGSSVSRQSTQSGETRLQLPLRQPSQPSSFFRPKAKRSEIESTGMRKSLRSSSSSSAVPVPAAAPTLTLPKGGSLRNKARKVSKSLKYKLRNLFSLSKSETASAEFPEQHIEAQKSHVSTVFGSFTSGSTWPAVPVGGSLRRVSSNVASVHTVSAEEMPQSRRASIESQCGEQKPTDDKSRVTSWASSNPTISIAGQQTGSDWEKQRLSVIKENGLHSPSMSLGRQVTQTLPMGGPGGEGLGNLPVSMFKGPVIDSQRVYSALMKRLRETTQLAQIVEQQRRSSGDRGDSPRVGTPGSVSISSATGLKGTATPVTPTIRHVSSPKESLRESSIKTLERGSPMLSPQVSMTELDNPWTEQQSVNSRQRSFSSATVTSYMAYPTATAGDGLELSPKMDLVPWIDGSPTDGLALSEHSSASLSSPSRHLFRAAGSYRRTLQENMRAAEASVMSKRQGVASFTFPPDTLCELQAAPGDPPTAKALYCESVYSNPTPAPAAASDGFRSMVDEFPEPPSMVGDGSVFADMETCRLPRSRTGSFGGSADWTIWLAANASKLEPQFSPTRSERLLGGDFVSPRISTPFGHGHMRERAQICGDDDDDVTPSESPIRQASPVTTTQATQALQGGRYSATPMTSNPATPLPSPSRSRQSSPTEAADRTSRVSYGSPPPIPPRSCLRPSTSPVMASVQSTCDVKVEPPDQAETPAQSAAARRKKSLARIRSLNRMRGTHNGSPQAPMSACSRLAKRSGWTPGCLASESAASSPGLTASVERQFGAVSQYARAPSGGKENIPVDEVSEDPYGDQGTGLSGPLLDPQAMGSKRMVDLFLSSRRRRMVSPDDTDAFI